MFFSQQEKKILCFQSGSATDKDRVLLKKICSEKFSLKFGFNQNLELFISNSPAYVQAFVPKKLLGLGLSWISKTQAQTKPQKNEISAFFLVNKESSIYLLENVLCFFLQDVPKKYNNCAFYFTFHTSFIDINSNRLYIPRNELDNPHFEKFWHIYTEHFAVELFFEEFHAQTLLLQVAIYGQYYFLKKSFQYIYWRK